MIKSRTHTDKDGDTFQVCDVNDDLKILFGESDTKEGARSVYLGVRWGERGAYITPENWKQICAFVACVPGFSETPVNQVVEIRRGFEFL